MMGEKAHDTTMKTRTMKFKYWTGCFNEHGQALVIRVNRLGWSIERALTKPSRYAK